MKYLNNALDYIENRMLKITVLVTFIFSIFVFKKFWVDLINAIWVDCVMSKLYRFELWVTIIYGFMISLYYYYKFKNTEHYNKNRAYCLAFFIVIYVLCLFSKEWKFLLITVKDISFPWANFIFIIIPFEIYLYFTCNKKNKRKSPYPLLEIERTNNIDDEYKRSGYCNSVYNTIKTCFFEDQSFAVGISGSWGSGKTTFMKSLKKQFKDSGENISIIDFEPWKNDTLNLIIKSFFALLKNELKPFISDISIPIDKYVVSLIDSDVSVKTKLFLKTIHCMSIANKKSPYDQIKDCLIETKHRTLVFIDDIDRLDKNEIKEVLRLIRNTANFPYIQFIVAYDKDYVISILKNSGIESPTRYIEKFFNLEIALPNYERRVICEQLEKRLSGKIKKIWPNSNDRIHNMIYYQTESGEGRGAPKLLVPSVLKNIRDIIRFCNSFCISIYTINVLNAINDIEFDDLFYLELLRYRYTDIYMILANRPFSLFSLSDDSDILKYERTKIEPLIGNSYNAYDKELIEDLLERIFEGNGEKSLCEIRYFPNYFMLRLDDKKFTEFDFMSLMGLDKTELSKRAEEMYREKYNDEFKDEISEILENLYSRLDDEPSDKQKILYYENIYGTLKSLLKSGELENDTLKDEIRSAIIPHLERLNCYDTKHFKAMLDLYNYLDFRPSSKTINTDNLLSTILFKPNLPYTYPQAVIEERDIVRDFLSNITENEYIPFAINKFIRNSKDHDESDLLLDISELKEISFNFFKKYDDKLSKKGFELFYNCIDHIDPKTMKVYLMKEALDAMKTEIERKPEQYFRNFIRNTTSSKIPDIKILGPEPFYKDIFGSNDKFEDFLKSNASTPSYERVSNYWELYKNNDYKLIEFEHQGDVDDMIEHNFSKQVNLLEQLKSIYSELSENGGVMTKELNEMYEANNLYIKLRTDIKDLIKEK